MPGIRIVTDSACDLPPAVADEHNIEIVPLSIRFGETEYVDRRDLTPKEFWAKTAESKVLPETAAPSPGAFEEAFRNAATQGATGVVCVCLSSGLSATYQSAQLAAEAVKDTIPVRVIDSRSVTIAQGLLAIAGAEAAAAGKSLDEVTAVVERQDHAHARVRRARHAREPEEGRPHRFGPSAARFDAVGQAADPGGRRRGRRRGQAAHARHGARLT